MEGSRTARMKVSYLTGETDVLEFSQPVDAMYTLQRIQEGLEAGVLIMDMGDCARLVPIHQIRHIEVSPVPESMPAFAMRNVRKVKSGQEPS